MSNSIQRKGELVGNNCITQALFLFLSPNKQEENLNFFEYCIAGIQSLLWNVKLCVKIILSRTNVTVIKTSNFTESKSLGFLKLRICSLINKISLVAILVCNLMLFNRQNFTLLLDVLGKKHLYFLEVI